ncbi:MAG: hypothetical protein DSY57_03570, partial [Desulfobulbus sp.]
MSIPHPHTVNIFLSCLRLLKIYDHKHSQQPSLRSPVFFNSGGHLLLRFVVFFILTAGLIAPLPKSVFGNQRSHQITTFQADYTRAKKYLHALQQAPAQEKDRLQWLNGVRNFRRIYLQNPRDPLAPACLYMMARTYRQMFQRFHLPIDLDEAINSYQQLTSRFENNRLADDALFAVATLYEREKKDPERALELYTTIINRYPREKTRRIVMYSGDSLDDFAHQFSRLTQLSVRDIFDDYFRYSPYIDGGILAGYYRLPFRLASAPAMAYMTGKSEKAFAALAEKYLGHYDPADF